MAMCKVGDPFGTKRVAMSLVGTPMARPLVSPHTSTTTLELALEAAAP